MTIKQIKDCSLHKSLQIIYLILELQAEKIFIFYTNFCNIWNDHDITMKRYEKRMKDYAIHVMRWHIFDAAEAKLGFSVITKLRGCTVNVSSRKRNVISLCQRVVSRSNL